MTKIRLIFASSLCLSALCLSVLSAAPSPAVAAEAGDAARGVKVATQHCNACHKPKGSVPPASPVVVPTMGDLANAEQVSSETIMLALSDPTHPLKQGIINDQQAADVAAYILSLR
ncbi:MAG: cytochrome c [Pseudomonadota bacterium]|nr:cytochrome c [Pseudomonadota bacterium]